VSFTVWFTGLSGSGKTTVSRLVEQELCSQGIPVVRLDGDEVRSSHEWKLGFSRQDRLEQTRRLGELALMHNLGGRVCLVAAISPYLEAREKVRKRLGKFVEVYCSAGLATLVAKDVKGLYGLALAGQLEDFTGISAPYESPPKPEAVVRAYEEKPEESLRVVMDALSEHLRSEAEAHRLATIKS
jgi:adenylylsulfate kinase